MPLKFADPAPEAYSYPLLVRHLLWNARTASPEKRIFYRDSQSFSYGEFSDRVERLASLLAGLGAEQGSTVAMLDWDSHRYLEAYFAVPMMGAVLMTANVRLPLEQLAYTLVHSGAEYLLVHRDFFPLVDAMLPQLKGLKAAVAIMDGSEGDLPVWSNGEYEVLSAAASPFEFQDFDENALATTFYTTGTTGNPKAVCFTHRQLVLHTLAITGPFGGGAIGPQFGRSSVYMPLTPMFHVHAWGSPYAATLLCVKQVYPGRYEPDFICRLKTEHEVSYSHCVPTVLRMVLDAAGRNGADLAGWTVIIGGSALSPALYEEARTRGMHLFAGYGMSETGPAISLARQREGRESEAADCCAAGVAVPLSEIRIVDEEMRDVPRDNRSRGELIVRAPWATLCYAGDASASEELWRGGWLHTQDVATIDADGFIRIRDRIKDVIKTGGEWLDSVQLEQLVMTVPGVSDAAVIAAPDERWGERPLAIIVPEAGADISRDLVNQPIEAAIAEGTISRYARIERIEFVDRLPLTSVGKVDKKKLRALYANG